MVEIVTDTHVQGWPPVYTHHSNLGPCWASSGHFLRSSVVHCLWICCPELGLPINQGEYPLTVA